MQRYLVCSLISTCNRRFFCTAVSQEVCPKRTENDLLGLQRKIERPKNPIVAKKLDRQEEELKQFSIEQKEEEKWTRCNFPLIDFNFPDYAVSTLGRIRSIRTGHVMTPCYSVENEAGKVRLMRYKDDRDYEQKNVNIGRLICAIYNGAPKSVASLSVHHINLDKKDNRPENLKWLSKYGRKSWGGAKKPVVQISITGEVIQEFPTVTAAAEFIGTSKANLSTSISKNVSCKGYFWKAKNDVKDIEGEIWKTYNKYDISNFGRIKGKNRKMLIKTKMIHNRIRVTDQNFALADIVAELFIENPMKYTCVAHIDKNPYNCKAENLKWILDKLYHNETKHPKQPD